MQDRRRMLYCASAAIAFTDLYAGHTTTAVFRYLIYALWIAYAVVEVFRNGVLFPARMKLLIKHLLLMLIPLAVMVIYTVILWQFRDDVEFKNYTRMCSTCLYLFLAYGFAGVGYYYFKKEVLNHLLLSAVLSYFFSAILPTLLISGPVEFLKYMGCLLTGADYSGNIIGLEVHDLTFAVGFLFLYYVFFEKTNEPYHKLKIAVTVLLMFMGLKRIQLLAIAAAVLCYYVIIKLLKTVSVRAMAAVGICAVVLYSYLILIDSGLLVDLCQSLGINTMGRLELYSYAAGYYEVSPTFVGMGFTKFTRLFWELADADAQIFSFGLPYSIHSNIVELFIELGFYGFPVWLAFTIYGKPVIFERFGHVRVANAYLVVSVYMLVLYLTDNTFTYCSSQMLYFLIPLVCDMPAKKLGTRNTVQHSKQPEEPAAIKDDDGGFKS